MSAQRLRDASALLREIGGMSSEGDAAYYSTMSPPVALALAEWLDVVAARVADVTKTIGSQRVAESVTRENCLGYVEALALADAILEAQS